MEQKVIHISEVLKLMNSAMLNHQTVSFKAWKIGENAEDPERGMSKTYDHVYVTSHSKRGTYNILDPLVEDKTMKYRHVSEAMIHEFMNKDVIW